MHCIILFSGVDDPLPDEVWRATDIIVFLVC